MVRRNRFAMTAAAFQAAQFRAAILAIGVGVAASAHADSQQAPTPVGTKASVDAAANGRVADTYGKLPIRFEPNVGQAPAAVKYLAHEAGYSVALTEQGAVLGLGQAKDQATLQLALAGAAANPVMVAERRQSSISNYFIGSDSTKWHSDVTNYAAVRYQQVYPGIDWVVYGNPQQLEYDLVVAPNADAGHIKLKIDGADSLALDENGDLLVKARGQTVKQLKPVVYQTAADGRRQAVDSHYVIDDNQVAFALGDYDRSRELIIDPAFAYSTYLGGSTGGQVKSIAIDTAGNAYLFGNTTASDFPTVNPIQSTNKATAGATTWVAKMNAAGNGLIYSTYLGGSSTSDASGGIAIDSSGNVYVAGTTQDYDFPVVNAFQSTNNIPQGNQGTGFVAKLNASGNALVYSTYLGGSDPEGDTAFGIAVDHQGEAIVVGNTHAADFPLMHPFQSVNKAVYNPANGYRNSNGFVTKFNASGKGLVYSTYLGGSGNQNVVDPITGQPSPGGAGDSANAVAVDSSGNAYVVGFTASPDFPTLNPFQSTNNVVANGLEQTGFVTKLNASGSALVFSTYLGGSGVHIGDSAGSVALDSSNNVYVTGSTDSLDFPLANPNQSNNKSSTQGFTAFLSKLSSSGRQMVYSTYLGGSGGGGTNIIGDYGYKVAVDGLGDAFVAGLTSSTGFPTANSVQGQNNAKGIGGDNGFVTEFGPTGNLMVYSTYLGGSGTATVAFNRSDWINGMAVDSVGNAYVVGATGSSNFPTYNPFQATNLAISSTGPLETGFVTKILNTPPMPVGFFGTPGKGSVSLSWYANAATPATTYNVYMGTQPGGEGKNPVVTTSTGAAKISGLTAGKTYYFTVQGIDAAGVGPASFETSATPTN